MPAPSVARSRAKKPRALAPPTTKEGQRERRNLAVQAFALGDIAAGVRVLREAVAGARYTGKASAWAFALDNASLLAWVERKVDRASFQRFIVDPAHAVLTDDLSCDCARELEEALAALAAVKPGESYLLDTCAHHLGTLAFLRIAPKLTPRAKGLVVPARVWRETMKRLVASP